MARKTAEQRLETDASAAGEGPPRSLLRYKLVKRPEPAPSKPELGDWPRLLSRSLIRAVHQFSGLTAQFAPPSERRCELPEALERLPEDGLLLLLHRPAPEPEEGEEPALTELNEDGFETGLLALDGALVAGFVEWLTLNRFSPQPRSTARRASLTDAALLSDLGARLLREIVGAQFEAAAERVGGAKEPAQMPSLAGWEVDRAISDPRLLPALLAEQPYQLSQASLTLTTAQDAAAPARRGEIALLLPSAPAPSRSGAGTATQDAGDEAKFEAHLQQAVLGSGACLDTVLGRLKMPLAQALQLQKGMVLDLPIESLEGVELIARDGRRCAEGRLGQARGMRAIRITRFFETEAT